MKTFSISPLLKMEVEMDFKIVPVPRKPPV